MKAIKKLKSNRGATIIFAMAIFLVAVVISVSLITVSLTATKSSASQLEDEQAYLAVASAARIFQKEVEGKNVVLTKVGETITSSISGVSESAKSEPINNALITIAGGNDPTKITVSSPTQLGYDVDITFKVDDYSFDATFKRDDYSFDAIFSAYKKDKPGQKFYTSTMHFHSFVGAATIYDVDGNPAKELTKVRWSIYGEDTKRGINNAGD
ncbi:MAG: hypothetical protein E7301_04350 [Butyrivibrio sp.]|nr:hypothetical protein [Butyrivibrio sp.]